MLAERIFAIIGQMLFSIAGACVKWINVTPGISRTYVSLGIDVFTAAFSGIMVYFLFKGLSLPEELGYVVAGFSGYLGVKAIDRIGNSVMNKFGITEQGIISCDCGKTEINTIPQIENNEKETDHADIY